jgi:hypothetical protein
MKTHTPIFAQPLTSRLPLVSRLEAFAVRVEALLLRHRVLVAALIGLVIFGASSLYRFQTTSASADMSWPLCAARAVLVDVDPYAPPCYVIYDGEWQATMPLTTALVTLPFLPLEGLAASAVFGLSSGLLAYGLLREGQAWRLLLFTSAVYWQAFKWLQWSPLVTAVALLPWLLPLALVKPHIAIPVVLTRLTWRRALACAAFVALTFAIDPTWPWRWLPTTGTYSGYIPLLVLPLGPLLLLALSRWRTEPGRFLFLMAAVPQRASYDQTALWLIPQTAWEMLALSIWSWIALILWNSPTSVIAIYLGALALLLYRPLYARFVQRGGSA